MDAKQVETALLTEHFRYTPMTLLDEIINTMNEVVNRAIDAAEQGLLATDPAILGFADRLEALKKSREKKKKRRGQQADQDDDDDADPDADPADVAQKEIEEGVYQLETLLNSTIDHVFDKFEIYVLRNLLSVPEELIPHIRLEHYNNLDFTETEGEPTPESIRQLSRKLAETKKLEQALQREVDSNAALLSELDSLLDKDADGQPASGSKNSNRKGGSLSFLTAGDVAASIGLNLNRTGITEDQATPLQTHTGFVISQLGHLEQLLSFLRPKLQEPVFSTAKPVSGRSITEEDPIALRKAYLESRARKAVSRHGLGLTGSAGSINSVDPGRCPSPSELGALEQLVQPLRAHQEQ